jgi:hypothetical protein
VLKIVGFRQDIAETTADARSDFRVSHRTLRQLGTARSFGRFF